MIHPNMATMLSFIATDAPIARRLLRAARRARSPTSRSTARPSTATRRPTTASCSPRPASAPLAPIARADDPRLAPVRAALTEVATELAQAIVRDGEGATKFMTIRVEGGRDAAECRKVALGIAHSPLVKTAFFASDPNLGRIVCAIGNAAAPRPRPGARVVLARRRAGRRPRRPRAGRTARRTGSG